MDAKSFSVGGLVGFGLVVFFASPVHAQTQTFCPVTISQAYQVMRSKSGHFDWYAVVLNPQGDGKQAYVAVLELSDGAHTLGLMTPSFTGSRGPGFPLLRASMLVTLPHSFVPRSVRLRQATLGTQTVACESSTVAFNPTITQLATFDDTAPFQRGFEVGPQLLPEATVTNAAAPIIPDAQRGHPVDDAVQVSLVIDKDGAPAEVTIVHSCGVTALDDAALKAAYASTFQASRWLGNPVPLQYTLWYGFVLGGLP